MIKAGRPAAALFPVLLLVAFLPVASAQTRPAPGRPTPEATPAPRVPQDQVLDELKAIRLLLEKLVAQTATGPLVPPQTDERVTMASLPVEHVLGRADAPVTIVEFTDLQCPFCRQFHVTVFDDLKRLYIDTGKVRYLSRDLPLAELHPLAVTAARASRCAGAQHRFYEMRRAVLINNAALKADDFATFARDLGLDEAAFTKCLANPAPVDAAIKEDADAALLAGVAGTPVFVIGLTKGTGVEGVRVEGALPFSAFDARLKELLEAARARQVPMRLGGDFLDARHLVLTPFDRAQ